MLPSARVRRLGQSPFTASEWRTIIDQGFHDAGAFLPPPAVPGIDEENELTPTQKRVETLKTILEESVHEVPEPEDQVRHSFVVWLLYVLGAPGGAVTTLVHELIDGGNFNPLESLR